MSLGASFCVLSSGDPSPNGGARCSSRPADAVGPGGHTPRRAPRRPRSPGRDGTAPPGWPEQVRPPGAPDWERTAVGWLYDLVPPEYRSHEVLRRYPVLLARFAADHVAAGLEAARAGWRTVRVELADELPPEAMEAAMAAYEREGADWRPRPAPSSWWAARCGVSAGCRGCDPG